MRPTTFLCGKGAAYSPASVLAGRLDVADREAWPATVFLFNYLFASEEAAATAVRESRLTSTSCADLGTSTDEARSLPFSGGDEGYALRSDVSSEGMPPERRYVAVVRVGASVSVVAVQELNGTVDDGQVVDLAEKVTDRMQAAYGGSGGCSRLPGNRHRSGVGGQTSPCRPRRARCPTGRAWRRRGRGRPRGTSRPARSRRPWSPFHAGRHRDPDGDRDDQAGRQGGPRHARDGVAQLVGPLPGGVGRQVVLREEDGELVPASAATPGRRPGSKR